MEETTKNIIKYLHKNDIISKITEEEEEALTIVNNMINRLDYDIKKYYDLEFTQLPCYLPYNKIDNLRKRRDINHYVEYPDYSLDNN